MTKYYKEYVGYSHAGVDSDLVINEYYFFKVEEGKSYVFDRKQNKWWEIFASVNISSVAIEISLEEIFLTLL